MSKWSSQLINELKNNKNKIKDLGTGKEFSYEEIFQSAVVFGKVLNLPKQSIISVILPNSFEFIVTYITCSLYGYIFAPLPYFLNSKEIEKALSYHTSEIVITDRVDLDLDIRRLIPEVYDNSSSKGFKVINELPTLNEDLILSLYNSSGTSGNPKGILYSHRNQYSLVRSIVLDFGFNKDELHFILLPFGHTASLNYSVFPSLFLGSRFIFTSNFEAIRSRFFRILDENNITYVQVVPTIIHILLKLKENTKYLKFNKLPYIGCGSAPLSVSVQKEFQKIFGIKVANLYGLSETGPTHFDNPNLPSWEPGSLGRALTVNKCKIATDGEILIKGPNVMVGYFKNSALTNQCIIDGWFHTGDYGIEDKEKFYFRDRKKDLIIVGGINIYPGEIEEILYSNNRVIECVVFGVPDLVQGEKIVACIVPVTLRMDEVNELRINLNVLCRKLLSPFKVPSELIFRDLIPKTPSGKLLRRKVKEQYIIETRNIAD